jgi:transposase
MKTDDGIALGQREQQRLGALREVLAGHWSVEQASQVLGLSVRQIWRLKAAFEENGAAALVHGNKGKPSPGKIATEVRQRVAELAKGQYAGCNDTHLTELLALREDIVLKRKSVERILRSAGVAPARRRRAAKHRRRRDRMPQEGMLLQMDGSSHHWLGEGQPEFTLLCAVDDATGRVVAATMRQEEDAHGYFLLLRQLLLRHGVPMAVYRDRHGIFQRDPKAPWSLEEQLAGRRAPTQFGRALEELAIHSIPAGSPQAKGRIERLWGSLQDRLVAELRLFGICGLQQANAFLGGFLERYNASFAQRADDPGMAYTSVDPNLDLDRVLSFSYPRVVANDNTVRLDGRAFDIPPGPGRRGYAAAHVLVHEMLDGSFGVWHEDRWILRTEPEDGNRDLRARKRNKERPAFAAIPTKPQAGPPSPGAVKASEPSEPKKAASHKPSQAHPWRKGLDLRARQANPLTESRTS